MSFFKVLVGSAVAWGLVLAGLLLTLVLAAAAVLALGGVVLTRVARGRRPWVPGLGEVMAWLARSVGVRTAGLGAWPGRPSRSAIRPDPADVVEVSARELPQARRPLPDGGSAASGQELR